MVRLCEGVGGEMTCVRDVGVRDVRAYQRRALGLLPPPPKPRLAGVWALLDLPEAGKPAAGWGRGGEGGWCG
jgi:hypothetical protein